MGWDGKLRKRKLVSTWNSTSLYKTGEGRPKKLEGSKSVLKTINLCHTLPMASSTAVHEIELNGTVFWGTPKI